MELVEGDDLSQRIARGAIPVRHASNGRWVLVVFDVQSGQERRMVDLNLPPKATLSGFSLHPNGKSFATAMGIARHDIWLLEGFDQPSRWLRGF